jgi:chloride channel 3/4/5
LITAAGYATGQIAGCIDVLEQWLSDIKDGYCSFWYLNKDFCCFGTDCDDWSSWSSLFLVKYAIHLCASVLFAGASALLVCTFAPYSAGSGIPEVKTILGISAH